MARPASQSEAAPIRLKTAVFTPAKGEKPDIPPGLTIAGYAVGQRGYYIVQFDGVVEDALKESVTAVGAELLDYIPDNAFKVRMNPGQANRVAKLDGVAWVGLFQPAYKLSPELASEGLFTVRVERGAEVGKVVFLSHRRRKQGFAYADHVLHIGQFPHLVAEYAVDDGQVVAGIRKGHLFFGSVRIDGAFYCLFSPRNYIIRAAYRGRCYYF
jgi:hypothetical protein